MAWTTPRTWVTGEVVTAALLNAQIKGNSDLAAAAIMTTAGDIIYASSANTPARLAKDANATRVLTNTGTSNVPAWAQVTLTSGVTGTLPVGNGGTGATSLTDGGVLLGNGSGALVAMAVLADGELIVGDGTTDPVAESGATLRTSIGVGTGDAVTFGGLTLGSDGSGVDAIFYSGTAGDNMTWDASDKVLNITGTDAETALDILDGDVKIVDKLYFYDRGGEYISSNGSLMTLTGNVTVSGDFTVSGTTTTVNSTVTTVADPLTIWAYGTSGSASNDAGFVIERGDDTNAAFLWDESADEFVAVTTNEDGTTAGNVTIAAYADIHGKDIVAGALLDANGTVDADVTDFDVLSSGDIDLVSSYDAAAAVYIAQSTGTSGTVKIHADTGTSVTEGAESINILSDVGGVGIRSTANLANAVNITVDGGTTSTMTLFNDQGTSVTEGAASIALVSDAGGVELRSTANLANAINITNDGGTTGSIAIFNDQGTSVTEGAESISLLSDAGGVGIRSTANLANAVNITADGGTTSTIQIFNDQGTAVNEGVASIQLLSDVGGIGVKSGLNAAGAIRLTADAGTSETIILHADQGTGADSINIMSDDGGITLAVADGKSILLHGSTVFNDEVSITYNATDTVVDCTKGNKFDLTFGAGNITDLYLHPPDGPANIMLRLIQDGTGSRVVTNWFKNGGSVGSPSGTTKVHFAGGAKPTLTTTGNAVDVFAFYYDGTNWHGTSSLDSKAYS